MSYCVRADIATEFGIKSVDEWAAIDPNATESEIEAKIEDAIACAADEIDDMLRGGVQPVPLTVATRSLRRAAAIYAGRMLFGPRASQQEEDQKKRIGTKVEWADNWLSGVRSGRIQLDSEDRAVTFPQAVEDPDDDSLASREITTPDVWWQVQE